LEVSKHLQAESLTDALIECVKAAGGSKVVGHSLWPEKMVDAAQRHLLNCLQDGRSERLTPDQVWLVLKLAHNAGCHAGMEYLSATLGYAPPSPVSPIDEVAQLRRDYIDATHMLSRIAARLESFEDPVRVNALKVVS
jgi:hypothetical protein